MILDVRRSDKNSTRTMGMLFINNLFAAYTLEPPLRIEKVAGDTAIPAGLYSVTITHSPHFNEDLPLINNVPNFEGVRLHAGNFEHDTRGCVLVGLERTENTVLRSRIALQSIQLQIQSALDKGEAVDLHIG